MNKRKGCVLLLALDLLLFGILFFSWNHTYGSLAREEVMFVDGGVETSDGETGTKTDGFKEKGKIALTFDDGPYPNYTRQILEGLKNRNV